MFRAGWRYNSIDFYWRDTQASGHVPVYRAWNGSDHFLTTNASEFNGLPSSYSKEGVAGYVAETQLPGYIPLHRAYDPQGDDHQYTIDKSHIDMFSPPLQYEGIIGYVRQHLPHPFFTAGHVPVYFAFNARITDSFYTHNVEELLINGYDVYPLLSNVTTEIDCTVNKNKSGAIITYPTNGSLKWKLYDEGINYSSKPHFVVQFHVTLKTTDGGEFLPPKIMSLRLFKAKETVANPFEIPDPPAGEGGTGHDIIRGSNLKSEDTNLWKNWTNVYWEPSNGSWQDVTDTQGDESWNITWPHIMEEGIRPRTWCRVRPGSYDIVCPVNWCLRVADILDDYDLRHYMVLFEVSRNKRLKQLAIPFLAQRRKPIIIARRKVPLLESFRRAAEYSGDYQPWMKIDVDEEDKEETEKKARQKS